MLPSAITSTLILKLMNFELLLIPLNYCCYFPHKEEGGNLRPQESYSPSVEKLRMQGTPPTHLNSTSCCGA